MYGLRLLAFAPLSALYFRHFGWTYDLRIFLLLSIEYSPQFIESVSNPTSGENQRKG